MIRILLLTFVLLALVEARTPLYRNTIANPKSSSEDYLLPNNLTAFLYEVVLEPDFVTDNFNGSINISFTTWITTNAIVLHTHFINVTESTITLLSADGSLIGGVLSADHSNDDRHFYTITFTTLLYPGTTYTISIGSFYGTLYHLDNYGFYLARYVDANGDMKKIATTQFQATAARRAFPCFDEPAIKARFDISIIRTAEYHSLSNTPQVSTSEISPGRFLDVFERTVVMSTYLIAFVVSDFTYVGRDIHKVYAKEEDIVRNRADYALDIGISIFDGIEEFVDIPYSLPKMDQISIPNDYFSAGAMENWGLVTYREEFLMYAPNVTSSDTEEFIAIIIAHEFGHQWFGNLVGPTWWKYLWLNEGFATYFEFYGGVMANDDLELFDQMVVQSVQGALGRDSTATTRHMNQDAGSPSDVDALFDIVAYDKAGSVIRMAEGFLTTPVFRRGLYIFLRNRAYAAAEPSDLYSAWQEALDASNLALLPGNSTVESIMTTWDSNAGYPLVTVAVDFASGSIQLSQRRFIGSNPNNTDESIWHIPISTAPSANANFNSTATQLWLTTRSATANIPNLQASDWLIVNVQQIGYYRVNYDTENWDRITAALIFTNFTNINRANRAQLVDDSYNLARYGVIDYAIPLRLTTYFTREHDYIAMFPFFQTLAFLEPYLANSAIYSSFQNYVLQILRNSYNYVGLQEFDNDGHLVKRNRERITTWICRYRDEACLEHALQRLRAWQSSDSYLIVPNQQTVLTCAALRIGTQADFDFVLDKYSREEMVVRRRLLRALGCSENESILNGFVSRIMTNGSQILASDRLAAFASIYNAGNFGLNYVLNYVTQNFAFINSSFTPAQITSLLNGLAARLSTIAQLRQLQQLASSSGASSTLFTNAIQTVENNVVWFNQYLGSIVRWLNVNNF